MRLTIELNITKEATKRWLVLGVTSVMGFAAAVAYAVPVTFNNGERLTAEQLNANFSNLETRLSAGETAISTLAPKASVPTITPWATDATLAFTAGGVAVPNSVTVANWRRVGDSIDLSIRTTFSGPPTGAGLLAWSLPNAALLDNAKLNRAGVVGSVEAYEASNVVIGTAHLSTGLDRIQVDVPGGPGGGLALTSPLNLPNAGGAGSLIAIRISFPVQGWTVTN